MSSHAKSVQLTVFQSKTREPSTANCVLILHLLTALFSIASDTITAVNFVQPLGGGNAKVPLEELDGLIHKPEERSDAPDEYYPIVFSRRFTSGEDEHKKGEDAGEVERAHGGTNDEFGRDVVGNGHCDQPTGGESLRNGVVRVGRGFEILYYLRLKRAGGGMPEREFGGGFEVEGNLGKIHGGLIRSRSPSGRVCYQRCCNLHPHFLCTKGK